LKLGELVESVSQGLQSTEEEQSQPQEQAPPAPPPTAQEPVSVAKEVQATQSTEPHTKQVQAQVSSPSTTAVQQVKQEVFDDSRLQKRSSVFGSFKLKMSEALEASAAEPSSSQPTMTEESPATIKKSKFGLSSVTNRVASATKSLKDTASSLVSTEDEQDPDLKAQAEDTSPTQKKGSKFGLASLTSSIKNASPILAVRESIKDPKEESNSAVSPSSNKFTTTNTNSSQSGSRKSVFGRLSIMSNSVLGSLETVKNEMEQVCFIEKVEEGMSDWIYLRN